MRYKNVLITCLMITNLITITFIFNKKPDIASYNTDYKEEYSYDQDINSDTINIKRATVYNAVVEQCDSDPFITADGSRINKRKLESGKLRWVALSQDLVKDKYKAKLHPGLFKGKFKFGDTLRVESKIHTSMNGLWVVRDVMNRRYRKSMDFLIPIKGERLLGKDFKIYKN